VILARPGVVLFLGALALRLLVFGYVAHDQRKFYTYDSDGYDRRAMNVLRYGQFASEAAPPLTPDLDRTPVYPLYLAAVFGAAGRQPWLAILLQLVVGALAAPLVYLLGRELRLPHWAGVAAGLIVALDPVAALNANRLLTETLFTTLVLAAAWMLVRYWHAPAPRLALGAAVLLALAALTRPIAQFLPLVVLPLFVVAARRAGRGPALAGAALFLAVSLGLTYSWAVRNYRATGLFTLSTISDTNLIYYRARAVLADVERISQDEAWRRLEHQVNGAVPAGEGPTPAQVVGAQRRIALTIFRLHPVETAEMLLKGVGRMLVDPGYTVVCTLLDRDSRSFECLPGTSSMNEPGMLGKALGRAGEMSAVQLAALGWSTALLGVVYAGALLGVAALIRERRWLALALLVLMAAYFVGLAAGAESNSRFRIPAMPFIALIAGVGLDAARQWLRSTRATATAPAPVTR
jgi:4-amino-4-deoxy-L-arabinose transferase-like glycosyltransferase